MLDNLLALILEWRFDPNLQFFLSSGGLALGTLGGIYLLIEYYRHQRTSKFLLFWSIGLLLLFWFRVPIILLNSGVRFYFSTFNIFLALTFPLAFVGIIFLLKGVQSVYPSLNRRKTVVFLIIWLVLTVIFCGAMFLSGPLFQSKASAVIVNLALFAPVRLLLVYSLVRWLFGWWVSMDYFGRVGVSMMSAGAFLGALQHFIVIPRLLATPIEFWFFTIGNFDATFIVEIISMTLLLIGVFLVHWEVLDKEKT